jgi:hypothetical protein
VPRSNSVCYFTLGADSKTSESRWIKAAQRGPLNIIINMLPTSKASPRSLLRPTRPPLARLLKPTGEAFSSAEAVVTGETWSQAERLLHQKATASEATGEALVTGGAQLTARVKQMVKSLSGLPLRPHPHRQPVKQAVRSVAARESRVSASASDSGATKVEHMSDPRNTSDLRSIENGYARAVTVYIQS